MEMNRESVTLKEGHNPYFNRWFSAIMKQKKTEKAPMRHNPYFNRWFSAIIVTATK